MRQTHYIEGFSSKTMHPQFSHANPLSNATIAFVCGGDAVTIPETLS
jgi:hypothetical protein